MRAALGPRFVVVTVRALGASCALLSLGSLAAIAGCDDNLSPLQSTVPDPPPPPVPQVKVCATSSVPPSTVAPVVLLTLDRSGSMGEPEPGGPTRWDAVVNATNALVSQHQDEMAFGLMLFPSPRAGGVCGPGDVIVGANLHNAAPIANALLPEFTRPNGGTPTAETLKAAGAALTSVPRGTPAAVVLATDGAPNCNADLDTSTCTCADPTSCGSGSAEAICLDKDDTMTAAEQLAAVGIPTYVIGLADTSGFSWVLDELAAAGGTARAGQYGFYPATDAASLGAALDDVRVRVERCQRTLSDDVKDAVEVSVNLDGHAITRDTGHKDGFDVSSDGRITLFGAACDQAVASNPAVDVDVCRMMPAPQP